MTGEEDLDPIISALARGYQCTISMLSVKLVGDDLVATTKTWPPSGLVSALCDLCRGLATTTTSCTCTAVGSAGAASAGAGGSAGAEASDGGSEPAVSTRHIRLLWNPWMDIGVTARRRFDPIFPTSLFLGCNVSHLPELVWQAVAGGYGASTSAGAADLATRYMVAEDGVRTFVEQTRKALATLQRDQDSICVHLISPQSADYFKAKLAVLAEELKSDSNYSILSG